MDACVICERGLIANLEVKMSICTECENDITKHFAKVLVRNYSKHGFVRRVRGIKGRHVYYDNEGRRRTWTAAAGEHLYIDWQAIVAHCRKRNNGNEIARQLMGI